MNDHLDDRLPFYTNRSLSLAETEAVEAHLAVCARCRALLIEWETLAGSVTLSVNRRLADQARVSQPVSMQLSPLVLASLKRRPSLSQAVVSASSLIWAQRVFLAQDWLIPVVLILFLFGFIIPFNLSKHWVDLALLPPFVVLPLVAALTAAFLPVYEDDPAIDIIAATPTSPGTLLMARLTLAMGITLLLAFTGSLFMFKFSQTPFSLFQLIASWLGPMLVLSGLTTALTLALNPHAAAAAALAAWGSVFLVLLAEQAGAPLLNVSLRWLLYPTGLGLVAQLLAAALLWLVSWLVMVRGQPSWLYTEGGSG